MMRHSDIRQAARDARAAQRARVWAAAALALVVGLTLILAHCSHFSPSPAFAASAVALALAMVPLAALLDRAHSGRLQSLSGARAKLSKELEASAERIAGALALAAARVHAARRRDRREPPPPPAVRARQIASLNLTPRLLAQRPQAARARAG
jgi:hypothetical protein